ncbi:hypothetical protein JCM19055_283 [Geomicrobium sp. JCM 19055]|nr:hypothetical protein JCM19055_283 [Geomicrobium sp. JCM 19055]
MNRAHAVAGKKYKKCCGKNETVQISETVNQNLRDLQDQLFKHVMNKEMKKSKQPRSCKGRQFWIAHRRKELCAVLRSHLGNGLSLF